MMPGLDADPELEEALGHAILGTAGASRGGDDTSPRGDDTSTEDGDTLDHLALVQRGALAEEAVRALLGRSVESARAAGHSWAAIGDVLGLSRQAVHQRFGGTPDDADEPEHRWLGPVTAFDELDELAIAGRRGWRTVGAGMLRHRMLRTDTQWEHRRVAWTRPVRTYLVDGWEVGCRAFPWLYLVRDLDLPPEPAPAES